MNDSMKSSLPELVWPPLPSGPAASMLAMLRYLDESQWWDAGRLVKSQLRQAEALVAHARSSSPFCSDRFKGFSGSSPLSMERWRELPLLTRADIQEAGDSLHCSHLPPEHGETFTTTTSGSTGQPVTTRGTGLTRYFWNVLTLRDHCWHKRTVDGCHAIIRVFDFPAENGLEQPDWGAPFNQVYTTGTSALISLLVDVSKQAEWLLRVNPRYLLTYPSNLKALLEIFEQTGDPLSNLRQVRTIGETLTSDIADACRKVWKVPVVDMYSSQEVGYIAMQCPDGDCYHAQSENLLVEVLDEKGNPCGPGQVGQVVVTALHNFATPLIRYAIGDYAEVGEPCSCGRGLPSLRRILGRRRNLLTLPTGERFWPIFGTRTFRDISPAIRQYQVIQTALDRLEVRLVTDVALSVDIEQKLRELVVRTVGYPLGIDFTYPGEIRVAAGKHEEFRSEI
jgi:phenylacetate-CoA ligase